MPEQKPPKPPTNTSEPNAEIIDPKAEKDIISAFAAAIRFRTIRSAVAAYNGLLNEQANTQSAFANLDRARLEALGAQKLLRDADNIHATDQLLRDIAHHEASERLKQMRHQAELAEKERAAEKAFVDNLAANDAEKSDMTPEEHELVDALLRKMKPDRYRAILEKAIKDRNLSPDDEQKAREIMEEIIRQSL